MRNWKILSFVALFASSGAVAEEVITSISHGTFELPFVGSGSPHVGELVTCDGEVAGQPLLRISSIVDRFDGVCDDLGSTPCNGRLIAIVERCIGLGDDPNAGESGLVNAFYGKGGKSRICWDPAGEFNNGLCTVEYEVATGESLGLQQTTVAGASSGQSITVERSNGGSPFRVDRKLVKIKKGTSTGHVVFEVSPPGAPPCFFPLPFRNRPQACGIATINIGFTGGQ